MKLALAALLLFSSATPALAGRDYQPGWSKQEKCFKRVYREEYVPGTFKNPGYVKTYKKRVRVPCESQREVHYMPFNLGSIKMHTPTQVMQMTIPALKVLSLVVLQAVVSVLLLPEVTVVGGQFL